MAPPSALALVGLAAWLTLHLLPESRSLPGNVPAAALQPAPPPSLAPPISPPSPAGVIEAPLDQVQTPSAPITQAIAEPVQHNTVQWRVPRRKQFFVRKAHGVFIHRWRPVFWASCRYQCNWSEPMVWSGRGGGG
jgi:hypothetical protein